MEAPADDQSPLTLPVSSLPSAQHFYLSALRPLGYCVVSHVCHTSVAGSSEAIGLGPQGTSRVDLFLSASHASSEPFVGRSAHVVFPASSRAAVRDVYAAALNAGAHRVSRPAYESDASAVFAATVTDLDGNRIEVAFSPPDPPAQGESIQRWREDVASSSAGSSSSTASARTAVHGEPSPMAHAHQHQSARQSPPDSRSAADGKPGPAAAATASGSKFGGNAVVGTVLGAAAGAALAYTMVRSKNDSSSKERDFASRMEARQRRLKDEAWAHQRRGEHDADMSKRRYSYADRDSGYYSERSPQWDPSPTRMKHRSITYPAQDLVPERGRSGGKMIEHVQRTSSPSSRGAPRRSSTVREAPRDAVMPARRSRSSAGGRGYELVRYEPTPPSMPPFPGGRSRRDSHGSGSDKRREITTASYSEHRRSSSRSQTGPPSVQSSTRTARRTVLPSSAAPPSAASAALTARALSAKEGLDGVGTGSQAGKLDELRTVVPDDSISCAPSRPDDSYERRSTASRRSRNSRHGGERPRSGIFVG